MREDKEGEHKAGGEDEAEGEQEAGGGGEHEVVEDHKAGEARVEHEVVVDVADNKDRLMIKSSGSG